MQFAKDSFFLALRDRLAGVNPGRTIALNGATVPGIVVVENLPPASSEPLPNVFYVEWGTGSVIDGHAGNGALLSVDCFISYYSLGTVASMVDRGRVLGQLDAELLAICQPANTEKRDYSQAPSRDLGTKVFWSQPVFEDGVKSAVESRAERHADARVERRAMVKVYFFSEVTLS